MGLRICVICDECGKELVVNPIYGPAQPKCDLTIYPSPCPICLKKEKEKGYQEGLFNGIEEGRGGG